MKKLLSYYLFSFLVLIIWIFVFYHYDLWPLFKEHYIMAITMAFGSFIAGATSEGGGAVAFPVMTLALKISPWVARDFSLLIQSFGMSAASLVILKKKIPVEFKALLFASFGAIFGNFLAFYYLESLFTPPALKIFFCSLWMSFIFVLFKVKWKKHISSTSSISYNSTNFTILFFTGLIGGSISGLTGSGLDIITFCVLTLYFKVSVKLATPTSVVLMAINSLTCILIKNNSSLSFEPEAFEYLLVCIPIVIFGAPLGSLFINKRSEKFITALLFTTITIQFIASLLIIPLTIKLGLLSFLTILTGTSLFYLLSLKKTNF